MNDLTRSQTNFQFINILVVSVLTLGLFACGGGSGSDSSDNTTKTIGTTKAWGTPVLLDKEDGRAGSPAVAADRVDDGVYDGSVIAIWSQFDGTQNSVFASRYTNGAWVSPVAIESESSGGFSAGTSSPQIAMGNQGQAMATWVYRDGNSSYSIWANQFSYGDPDFQDTNALTMKWQAAAKISPISGNSSDPQVSFDGKGHNSFLVWSQYQFGSAQYNYRSTYKKFSFVGCLYPFNILNGCAWTPADFGWNSPSLLDPHDLGDASEQQIAAWGTNNAFAVWTQHINGLGNTIYANSADNGSWGTAERINTGSVSGAAAPVVAVDKDGNAIAAWFEFASGRNTFYASRFDGSVWSGPVVIDDANAGDAAYESEAPSKIRVALDSDGNAIFVWAQKPSGGNANDILARRCPAGLLTACEAPVLIESSTENADMPALAIAPNGDAIAVWKQKDGGATRIYANHYSAANKQWDAKANLVGGAESDEPQVAIDGGGTATVVWTEYDSGKYDIYANRYK